MEEYKSEMVEDLVNKIKTGRFFMQSANSFEKACYPQFVTQPDYEFSGIAELKIMQAAFEKNLNPLVITMNQANKINCSIVKGAKALTQISYKNSDAYWKEGDEKTVTKEDIKNKQNEYYDKSKNAIVQAKEGDIIHKKGEQKVVNGELMSDLAYGFVYSAKDVVKLNFIAEKDENGNQKIHQEDVFAKTKEGDFVYYKKDGVFKKKDGTLKEFKKGDKVILYEKGEPVIKIIPTKEKAFHIKDVNQMPKEKENLAPLYKAKNNDPKESLYEKISTAFNYLYTGKAPANFKVQFNSNELKVLEDFIKHPRAFEGFISSAKSRAMANVDEAAYIDNKRNEKIQSQQNINENINTKTKTRKN